MMKQQFCRRGHDLSIVGKNKNGCRACGVIRAVKYREEHPWLNHYVSAHMRVLGKGAKSYIGLPFTLTSEQVRKLWFRDKAYLMKEPSIDRIINKKGYIFSNCQFMELVDNTKKH